MEWQLLFAASRALQSLFALTMTLTAAFTMALSPREINTLFLATSELFQHASNLLTSLT